jgi:hypothetical protein
MKWFIGNLSLQPLIAAEGYYFFSDKKAAKTKRSDLMNTLKK